MNTRHLSQEDLALFALQLLEGDELAAAVDHLEACEDCRHDVARFHGDLVGYALAMSEPATPPAAARERLLKQVGKEKKIVPPERVAPPLRRSSSAVPIASQPSTAQRSTPQDGSGRRELERLAQRARELSAQQQFSPLSEQRESLREDARLEPIAPPVEAEPVSSRVADGDVFLSARGRRMFDMEPLEEKPARSRSVVTSILGWTGWALAAGLGTVAYLQFHERQSLQSDVAAVTTRLETTNDSLEQAQNALRTLTDQGAMQVSLREPGSAAPQKPKPGGHAAYDAQRGALVFIGEHLDTLPAGKVYELWLLQPNNPDNSTRPPVPAGTFRPDARGVARLMLPEIPKGLAAQGFAVSVEPDGGSPQPTSAPILAGF